MLSDSKPGPNGYPSWTCPKCGEICEGVGPVTLTIARICHERDKHSGPDILGHPLVPKREVVMMPQEQLECHEPWRCTSCQQFMYNMDANGKPCFGAPQSHWWSNEHPRVCSLCYSLVLLLTGKDYWSRVHEEDRKKDAERREKNKKLGPGGTYFPGA